MDVQIGEVSVDTRVTDADALLSPQLMEQLVRAVLNRLKAEQEAGEALRGDAGLKPGASQRQSARWSR
jgi:hypothetical protein